MKYSYALLFFLLITPFAQGQGTLPPTFFEGKSIILVSNDPGAMPAITWQALADSIHPYLVGAGGDPVGYFDMLQLLKYCSLVITDSGGLQKEAYFNKKPCVIAREETEWVELVDAGFARIVGSNSEQLKNACVDYLNDLPDFNIELYGREVGSAIYHEIAELLAR